MANYHVTEKGLLCIQTVYSTGEAAKNEGWTYYFTSDLLGGHRIWRKISDIYIEYAVSMD